MSYQSATMGAMHSIAGAAVALAALNKLDRGEDERAKAMKRMNTIQKDYRKQGEAAARYRGQGNIEKAKKYEAMARKTRGKAIATVANEFRTIDKEIKSGGNEA